MNDILSTFTGYIYFVLKKMSKPLRTALFSLYERLRDYLTSVPLSQNLSL